MKKIMVLITALSLVAVMLCSCNVTVNNGTDKPVGIANPWRDCTEEEAYQYAPNGFSAPSGATNVRWSMMLPNNDPAMENEMLVQMDFDLDGVSYTAREQGVGDASDTDISGMFYDWQTSEEVTLANWAGGNMKGTVRIVDNSDESARLCSWYDVETGYAYSLSASGKDLENVDIKAVAEAIYDPEKQIGANASQIPESCPEEATDEFLASAAAEAAPDIDISGCDTFTQIVDTRLSEGMGYANEKLGDEDVLLVCSGTYDNLDGNMAAIDATVFMYKDGVPYEVGKVCSAGTADPLMIADGALYTGSHHWTVKYTIEGDRLIVTNKAVLEYDEKGNEVYYYEALDGVDVNNYDTVKTKAMFESLQNEMYNAKVINFTTVGKAASSLPQYEYPGPELFYSVLYKYLTDEFGDNYPDAEVTIPCPVIIAEDESNKDDILVWGDFWIFKYNLNGDILECSSGGSYPGLIHVKSIDESAGYEVTGMDLVGDGSEYEPTAKKIFGKHYDELVKMNADESEREKTRAQIIANYAAANDLDIKAYQDYGWDPVSLPEENIDSFYSILD